MHDHWDDPKYLAYALGELSKEESARVQAELADSPGLRNLVDQYAKAGKTIEQSLAKEDKMKLTDKQHKTLEQEIERGEKGGTVNWQGRSLLALAAAAVIAICIGIAIIQPGRVAKEESSPATGEIVAVQGTATEEIARVPEKEDTGPETVNRSLAKETRAKLLLTLPKPQFVGTPKTIKSENLIAPSRHKRYIAPVIMIPEDAENLALNKSATSSDTMPIIGEISFLTDGDKEGSDGSFVELGPGKQYIQIDLGEESTLHAVALWHYHSEARVYHDVVVQVSNDPDFLESVVIFNNYHDKSSGLVIGKDKEYIETNVGILFGCEEVKGRYIRFHSNGSTASEMNHYIEAEVYGVKADEGAADKAGDRARLKLELPRPMFCG